MSLGLEELVLNKPMKYSITALTDVIVLEYDFGVFRNDADSINKLKFQLLQLNERSGRPELTDPDLLSDMWSVEMANA